MDAFLVPINTSPTGEAGAGQRVGLFERGDADITVETHARTVVIAAVWTASHGTRVFD